VAWGPFAMSVAANREEAARTYGRALTGLVTVGALGTVALSLASREALTLLAGARYAGGASLVPIQCFGYLAWVSAYVVGIGVSIAKKTYHNSLGVTLSAVVALVAGIACSPRYGPWGAAGATLAGQLAYSLYMYLAGRRYFPIEQDNRVILTVIGTSLVAVAVGIWVDHGAPVFGAAAVGAKATVFVLLVGIWFASNVGLTAQLRTALGRP